MINCIKKLFQVQVNTEFITITDIRLNRSQSLKDTATKAEAKTIITKITFIKETKQRILRTTRSRIELARVKKL